MLTAYFSNSLRNYILAFIVTVGLIGIAGYGYFLHHKRIMVQEERKALSAIADMKAGQIGQWRMERLADVASVYSNAMIARQLNDYLNGKADSSTLEEFRLWMKSFHERSGYCSVDLFKPDGELLVSVRDDKAPFDENNRRHIEGAVRTGEVIFSDFHKNAAGGNIHLNLIVPVKYPGKNSSGTLAVLVFGIDPDRFLYPLIQSWPSKSRTSETLLVERNGTDVVYLNKLRYNGNAALSLQLPLSNRTLPSVRAALGEEDVFEGVDYRGVPVLAATRIIHGSPWAIVAKTDTSEIFAPVERRAWFVALAGFLMILTAGLGLYLLWNRKNADYLRKQYEAEQKFTSELENRVKERTADHEKQLYFTQTLLDAIPNPVFFKDVEGRYLGCNKAFEKFRGIKKEDLTGKNVFDTSLPEAAERLQEMDRAVMRDSATRFLETSVTVADGSRRTVIYHKARFTDNKGEPAGLIGVIQDINDLKVAEGIIQSHNEELEQKINERTGRLEDANRELTRINRELDQRRLEAESFQEKLLKLSRAIENSPATVVITDKKGLIEYVNPKFSEITGYSADEAIGENPKILNARMQPDQLYRELWETINAGDEWRGEFCNIKKDGEIFWEQASISPIRNEKNEITNFVAVKEDITAQKKIAEELLKSKEAADAANKSKSEFLANMSHEIRTPLNAIIGFSSLALKTGLLPRQRDYISKISKSGASLLNIVNDILDFSKIEAGKLEMERIPFLLDDVLSNATSIVQQKAHDKGLDMLLDRSGEVPPSLVGDQHRLGQIITNLLGNAVKFTEKGQVVLAVKTVELADDRIKLEFSVRDTGIGLSIESAAKLFQPFTQADGSTTRKFGGTGLGLSISKQLVEMMGGDVWCESELGLGSVFSFTAWFGVEDRVDDNMFALTDEKAGQEEPAYCFSGTRILLVEDNEMNQMLAVELLKPTGALIDIAGNGEKAVQMITNSAVSYDLVLMDIQMPVMDGYEATRRIHLDHRFAGLPIIAMTAHAMLDEQKKMRDSGMNGYVSKPVNAHILYKTIKRHLHKTRPDKQPATAKVEAPLNETTIRHIPGVDSVAALARLGGDENLYLWVLREFIDKQAGSAVLIKEALDKGESGLAERLAHTVKGIAATIGAAELQETALLLERAIKQNSPDEKIHGNFELFSQELKELVQVLQRALMI